MENKWKFIVIPVALSFVPIGQNFTGICRLFDLTPDNNPDVFWRLYDLTEKLVIFLAVWAAYVSCPFYRHFWKFFGAGVTLGTFVDVIEVALTGNHRIPVVDIIIFTMAVLWALSTWLFYWGPKSRSQPYNTEVIVIDEYPRTPFQFWMGSVRHREYAGKRFAYCNNKMYYFDRRTGVFTCTERPLEIRKGQVIRQSSMTENYLQELLAESPVWNLKRNCLTVLK